MKQYSEDLIKYIKELKYANTSEDKMYITLTASKKVRDEYKKLSYKEIRKIEDRI